MIRWRNEEGGVLEAVVTVMLVGSLIYLGLIYPQQEKDRQEVAQKNVDLIEETYDVDVLGAPRIRDTVGNVYKVKVKKDDDILECDLLTEKNKEFTITCDSPNGRLTLEAAK